MTDGESMSAVPTHRSLCGRTGKPLGTWGGGGSRTTQHHRQFNNAKKSRIFFDPPPPQTHRRRRTCWGPNSTELHMSGCVETCLKQPTIPCLGGVQQISVRCRRLSLWCMAGTLERTAAPCVVCAGPARCARGIGGPMHGLGDAPDGGCAFVQHHKSWSVEEQASQTCEQIVRVTERCGQQEQTCSKQLSSSIRRQ